MNDKLNCNAEMLMGAVEQLKSIDTHKKGLLYGVPISIKENLGYKVIPKELCTGVISLHVCSVCNWLCVQGHDSTCGVLCKLDQPAVMDSVVVAVLKRQGAIPFVKTNVPQGLLR